MSFSIEQFAGLRPYLFHLTDPRNLRLIRTRGKLFAADLLCREAGQSAVLESRRLTHVPVNIEGNVMLIRDQAPLHKGNMALTDGWTFQELLAELNSRVFFWPGRRDGRPIESGVRHFGRYAREEPVLIRVSTETLLQANNRRPPHFAKYNTGSPRCTGGKGSPRGPSTFTSCEAAQFDAASVIELTYDKYASLPDTIEVGTSLDGPWRKIELST